MSIQEADDRAQGSFAVMVNAYVKAGHIWTQPEVDEYLNREEDLRWEEAKAEMDAMQEADHGWHLHSGEPNDDCPDCQEATAAMWDRMSR
jgi:hypothetical protein